MTAVQHTNFFSEKKILKRHYSFLLMCSVSAAALAGANGIVQLPDSYRTPLSDTVYEEQNEWRAKPEENNPWREDEGEPIIKSRFKSEFFPEYDYDTVDDPNTRSLFQNEDEIERPRTNIFKYTF